MLAKMDKRVNMDGQKSPIRITAPEIQQKQLSFCDGSLDGFEAWAKKLPMANTGASAKLLFQAIREMNITAINNVYRYKMLEIIRNQIYTICEQLGKRILNQSVMLNENELKIVSLVQTLQSQLANGYKRVILDEVMPSKKLENKKLITFSIHRAIWDTNQTILRSLQLYSKSPTNAWLELHQLYILAESKGVHEYPVKDSQAKYVAASTIKDVYIRILLLGCCGPNQLRQQDLQNLYDASELWSPFVKISSATDPKGLFLFAQHRDLPPIYRNLLKESPNGLTRSLIPNTLVMAFQKHLDHENEAITIPKNITEDTITHLVHAWGAMVERSFRRTQNNGEIELAIGLSSSHFFSANEHSFPFLMKQWKIDNLPAKKDKKLAGDVWDHSFDAGNKFMPDADNIAFDASNFLSENGNKNEDTGPKSTAIKAKIIDTSPGGYGVLVDNPSGSVQTGELVVIKEHRMNNWSLGCIRWIRTQRLQGTQLGIELLSPKVESVAVRILNKTGENGSFLRGLRIPAMPAAGQSETLILPTIPFKVGCKAELVDAKQTKRIQLIKRLHTSRSFIQYEFNSLTQVLNNHDNLADGDDEFASIWDKL